jgi:hypothetical protein
MEWEEPPADCSQYRLYLLKKKLILSGYKHRKVRWFGRALSHWTLCLRAHHQLQFSCHQLDLKVINFTPPEVNILLLPMLEECRKDVEGRKWIEFWTLPRDSKTFLGFKKKTQEEPRPKTRIGPARRPLHEVSPRTNTNPALPVKL